MHSITSVQYYKCTVLQVYSITSVQYYKCTVLQVYSITSIQYYKCTVLQMTVLQMTVLQMRRAKENAPPPHPIGITRAYELITEAHAKLSVVGNCSKSSLRVCLSP
jgi:hypothetical protein